MIINGVNMGIGDKAIPTSALTDGKTKSGIMNELAAKVTQGYNDDGVTAIDIFYDYSYWMGINNLNINRAFKDNPGLVELMDFYFSEKVTTFGQAPLELLFLDKWKNKYGLSTRDIEGLKQDVQRRSDGTLAWALLLDTANFIMTGKRDIPLFMLEQYIHSDAPVHNPVVKQRFKDEDIRRLTSEEFFTRWVSTRNGMNDCIEVLTLVFQLHWA